VIVTPSPVPDVSVFSVVLVVSDDVVSVVPEEHAVTIDIAITAAITNETFFFTISSSISNIVYVLKSGHGNCNYN
jgi:hypothetical protein